MVRVLLVEDEALVAMIAEEALMALGFTPISARDGAEAIEQFHAQKPAMAVVDVGLPDIRGDELARRLRALAPDMPVVVASGYDELELKAKFADDSGVQVLAKPYTEDDLARVTRSLGVTPGVA